MKKFKCRIIPELHKIWKSKLLMTMRLTVFILLIGIFQGFAAKSYAQLTMLNLNAKNSTIKEVLNQIEKQSEFFFLYNSKLVDVERQVDIDVKNQNIAEVLNQLFTGTNTTYKIVDRQIVLTSSEIDGYIAGQQQNGVTGRVTDHNSVALPGVSVVVKGTTLGTITDNDGKYSISNVSPTATMVFSFVGMRSQEIAVDGKSSINVTLLEEAIEIEEVVAVGYGTQKKVNLTGAVSQVKSEEIADRMAPTLVSNLQGVVPNLNLSYGNSGGEPGSSPAFNIRGAGSLSGGNAFVLVDGVQQDMNSVNPNDIESISVLKDASASAIYGARAAYGVILITTKKGHIGDKPIISYSYNPAWQKPTTLPDIVSSVDFATMVNDAFINAGQAKKYPDELVEKMKYNIEHPGELPTMVPNPLSPNNWDSNQLYANTNAYDAFYRKYSYNGNHNLSLSGGGNAFTYFISGGYYHQGPEFRYGDEYYNRYTLTANFSSQITKWLKLGLNSKLTKRKYQMPHVYPLIGDYYHDVPRRWPIWPVYDPNGHFAINTMALMAEGGRKKTDENQMLNSLLCELALTKNWKINADINFRQNFDSSSDVAKVVYMYQVDNTPVAHSYSLPSSYSASRSNQYFQSNNLYTSYEVKVGRNSFKVMVGGQSELYQNENISLIKNDLISNNVPFITTATGATTLDGSKGRWGTLGVFGRINYNFDEKLLLELSSRYDGSSRFQTDRRWGFFPSFSVGYNIARESFWKNIVDKISLLKIRASYGTLGNQSVGSNFPYLANLGINTNLDWVMGSERPLYVTAPGLVSPELTWETTTTLNFGLDAVALRNRLSLSFDWYERTTDNMFGPLESYPNVLGVNPPKRNNASLETKGFELSIGWNDKIRNVKYYVKLNLSDNITTITKYQNKTGILTDYYVGKKLGEIWGYTTVGLFQTDEEILNSPDQTYIGTKWTPGDVHYADLNDDKKVNKGTNTLSDPGDQSVIGNSLPRYSYGVNLGLEWKGFYLDMLWQGVVKRDFAPGGANFYFGDAGNFNQITIFKEHLDYWRPDNTDAFFPKPYMTSLKNKDIQVQTRYIEDASYLRLKNLQLGYNLPSSWAEKILLGSLRFYITGENLLTFTKLLPVFDPENLAGSIGVGKVYPISTIYSLGVSLTLK
jgi:TonB-linked SusC/RagA family outer membrane protein